MWRVYYEYEGVVILGDAPVLQWKLVQIRYDTVREALREARWLFRLGYTHIRIVPE